MSNITTNLNPLKPSSPLGGLSTNKVGGPSAEEGFKKALEDVKNSSELKSPLNAKEEVKAPRVLEFSNHAVERMRSRGVYFTPDQLDKIDAAHMRAKEKGAKETLVLTDKAALIISVKNNKVVTVMDKAALKDNVFTNIDSTVVV